MEVNNSEKTDSVGVHGPVPDADAAARRVRRAGVNPISIKAGSGCPGNGAAVVFFVCDFLVKKSKKMLTVVCKPV